MAKKRTLKEELESVKKEPQEKKPEDVVKSTRIGGLEIPNDNIVIN